MDINALLSPPEGSEGQLPSAPSSASNSPTRQRATPNRPTQKRNLSSLSREITRSPENSHVTPIAPQHVEASQQQAQQAFPAPAYQIAAPGFRPIGQAPTSDPTPQGPRPQLHHRGHSARGQSGSRPSAAQRVSSAPRMDTLADLASLQRHQMSRTNSATSVRTSDYSDPLPSPSKLPGGHSSAPELARKISTPSMAAIMMAEAPSSTPPPGDFITTALTETESKTVTDLLNYLADNSYQYDAHVELISVLHRGLVGHVYPPTGGNVGARDARSYPMLAKLRQARDAMDSRFAVGQVIWEDWLADEMLAATSSEERIAMTELCQRAVQDEPCSVKLWSAYADWIASNYAACHDLADSDQAGWIEEDKEVCRDLFTKQMLLDVLEQAVTSTQWRIDACQLLWTRYIELVQEGIGASPSRADVDRIQSLFINRLQTPHSTWDETAQLFWAFVSNHNANQWEGIMSEVNKLAEPAKRQMGLREQHEMHLQQAVQSGDRNALLEQYGSYLRWERKHTKRGVFAHELCSALYERALLAFPTHTEWWLDYVEFVTESNPSTSVLPLIERATRHCPWSGDLWAKRILRSDVERKSRDEIEATKHRATNSGLVDMGGMEELIKVLAEWCSFLRRHAFRQGANEDDLDTAEVGIIQALEDVEQTGRKLYGKDFKGDPFYRLEQIEIKFYSEARRFNDARDIWRKVTPRMSLSFEFWWRYYNWELWLWGYERITEKHRVETTENGPHLATAVLDHVIRIKQVDWPEKVLDMYLYHFTQHESAEKLQGAQITAREYTKQIASRRALEATEAAEAAAQQHANVAEAQFASAQAATVGDKRKRDEETLTNGNGHKKTKQQDDSRPALSSARGYEAVSDTAKRDREHSTVTVTNLTPDITNADIRRFFKDCGVILSVEIAVDKNGESSSATVEFETPEDASFAQSRDGRDLNGKEVQIQSGSQSTLYVANYPETFDEVAVRQLFDTYGEIISVRFPSLKFNSRRRFCYVRFSTSQQATAAESAMDAKIIDAQHRLIAKISDPQAKKQRSGAQAEGRELFIRNVEHSATEHEVGEFFNQYGKVVKINLVKLVNGRRTGSGFVVFETAEDASKALAANNKVFHDRVLHVELSNPKGGAAPVDKARKTDIIVKHSASPDLETANGRRASDVSMASSTHAHTGEEDSAKTARERKVAIFNLPDTVNDARITATMEEYGPITKIQLRRQDHGAIVEFANVKDAFRVRTGVDCSALGAGVETGDVADLLSKVRKRQAASAGAQTSNSAASMKPPILSRPAQRGGRRGGLGFKRGGFNSTESSSSNDGGKKSNAEFRAMFTKAKGDGADESQNE